MDILPLIASLVALLLGPLLYHAARRTALTQAALEGFIFASIAALILAGVLPDTLRDGGAWSLLFVIAGLFGPNLMERLFQRTARHWHFATLALAVIGLLLHTIVDGTALHHHSDHADLLPWAVVLHRLPVGLAVWWLLRPNFGTKAAFAILALMMAGTGAGYWLGIGIEDATAPRTWAWLQALVAGSILHVVFFRPHMGREGKLSPIHGWAEGFGNVVGLALALSMLLSHGVDHETGGHGWIDRLYYLSAVSAPALLLAYLLGGLLHVYMPASSVRWLKRGGAFGQSMRGVAIGLPMPVCSCGVLPLYQSLINKGAPPTAAMAFLIATPELGLDAILLSIPLLGAEMTGIRIVGAFVVALCVGLLIGRIAKINKVETVDCCHSHDHGSESDIDTGHSEAGKTRFGRAMKTGFGELVDSTGPWILFGLIVAAIAEPLLENPWIRSLPDGVEVPLFALLGLPVYVCAAGATPIVSAFLAVGISPGAGLAFLLTGPATNVSTFGVLSRLHSKTTAVAFGLVTMGLAVICGWIVNGWFGDVSPGEAYAAHDHGPSWWQLASFYVLIALFLFSLLRRGARAFIGEILSPGGHDAEHAH